MNAFAKVSEEEHPRHWWGPVWHQPVLRSIADLVREGVLSAAVAGLLWALLARRTSFVVVAGPSGAGKTTLATALLDFCPPGERRTYLRGLYEPFEFLTDPEVVPAESLLLVNEISPHLPIYLWGPGVRRVLEARSLGYQIAATAHATSVEELVGSLAGYPLRIPVADIAALQLLVFLDVQREGSGVGRRVNRVVILEATERGGLQAHPIVSDGQPVDPSDVEQAMTMLSRSWMGGPIVVEELGRREQVLQVLTGLDDAGRPPGPAMAAELARRYLATIALET